MTHSAPCALVHNGHRTALKWHRGRRTASDIEFGPARILEGMRLGASVEIDLTHHQGGGFAVLHDPTLERSTSGTGRVAGTDAATLRSLFLRDNAGQVSTDHVMLFADLCALIAEHGAHPEALLQLDLKDQMQALSPADLTSFARAIAPVTQHMIFSGGDAAALRAMQAHVPDLRVGYDPCHAAAMQSLAAKGDYDGFIQRALREIPEAEMIYLHYALILAAADRGVDLIAPIHAAGKTVDAYTIQTLDARTEQTIAQLLELRIDQLTTDDAEAIWARFSPAQVPKREGC